MKKYLLILLTFISFCGYSQRTNTFKDSSIFYKAVVIDSNLYITKGASIGKVLTSNGIGLATWQTINVGGRSVDTIYKKSTNRDLTYFKISGAEYSFKDSIGVTDLTSYALQSSLNDTASTLRRIRKVDSSYLFKNATRDSICMVTVINGNTYRTCAFDSVGGGSSASSSLFPNGLEIVTESRDFLTTDLGKLIIIFPGAHLTMPNEIIFPELFKTIGILQIDTTCWFEQEFGGAKIKSLTTENFSQNEIVLCISSLTDNDSASRLLFLSTAIINEQTAGKYLYDQLQNAIPLSGTEVDKPVTGDIEVFNGFDLKTPNANLDGFHSFYMDDGGVQMKFNNGAFINNATLYSDAFEILSDNPSFRGLSGFSDFSVNYQINDYTQLAYVGYRGTATLVDGTVTVATDKIKTGYKIYVSVNTPSGTQGFLSAPTSSIIDATSFVINSTSSTDDSTVNWWIAP